MAYTCVNFLNASGWLSCGLIILLRMHVCFCDIDIFFLFRSRVFSRVLRFGARREPARTPQLKCGPRTRLVARTLGMTACATCVSLFYTPGISHHPNPEGEPCVYLLRPTRFICRRRNLKRQTPRRGGRSVESFISINSM